MPHWHNQVAPSAHTRGRALSKMSTGDHLGTVQRLGSGPCACKRPKMVNNPCRPSLACLGADCPPCGPCGSGANEPLQVIDKDPVLPLLAPLDSLKRRLLPQMAVRVMVKTNVATCSTQCKCPPTFGPIARHAGDWARRGLGTIWGHKELKNHFFQKWGPFGVFQVAFLGVHQPHLVRYMCSAQCTEGHHNFHHPKVLSF